MVIRTIARKINAGANRILEIVFNLSATKTPSFDTIIARGERKTRWKERKECEGFSEQEIQENL